MIALLTRIWDRWFGGPLAEVETQAAAYRASPAGQRFDWKTVVVVLVSATVLTIQNYSLSPERLKPLCGFVAERISGPEAKFEVNELLDEWASKQATRLMWFAGCLILTYTLIPAFFIKVVFRERLRDYGLGVRGVLADWPVYATFAAIMLPLVALFSIEERFQQVYPFYRIDSRDQIDARFLRWECVYACQFMALEFFFRGFMVHGLKHRFGVYAVLFMVIPYCMVHFHKPWPETIGSIIAGVALGTISLITKSIWPGAALHILVAFSMDFSSLWRRGLIG